MDQRAKSSPGEVQPRRQLVALSENYTVKLWDIATLRELPTLKVPNSGAFLSQGDAFITFSDDGKRIATGGIDTDMIVWETETGKRLSNLSGRTNMAYNVAFSADGNELISGGRTRWDLRTGRGLRITSDTRKRRTAFVESGWSLARSDETKHGVISIVESPGGNSCTRSRRPG